jgi:hypothetical protein
MFAARFVSDQVNFIDKLYIRNEFTSSDIHYAINSGSSGSNGWSIVFCPTQNDEIAY